MFPAELRQALPDTFAHATSPTRFLLHRPARPLWHQAATPHRLTPFTAQPSPWRAGETGFEPHRVLPPLSLQDIITQDVATIAADAPLSAALDQMTTRRIRSVLVTDDGALAGIVTGHDLIRAAARGIAFATPVAALMSHPVLNLPAHTRLASAYGRMRRTGLRHLVVTGRDGTPAGIVSETDFFLHLSAAQLIGALTVADVMDPNPTRLGPDATLAQVLAAVATAPSDCAVLTHGSQPLVIVTEGSLLARLHEGADLVTTRLIDQPDKVPALATIATGASLPEARALFQSRQVRTLAVVHRDGALAGVLGLRALIGVALPDRGGGRAGVPTTTAPSRVRLRQFQRAVQQSPVSVIITDTDGTIEYVNPRFCEVTGYREDEVLGRNPRVLKSGAQDPTFYQALWRAISAGRVWKGELCNRRRDTSLYWEAATISPVRDDRGDIVKFVAVKEDITAPALKHNPAAA
ncbi:CBS domain-containing protein [uncultured Thiodictyon sp.]|uniref:CBS domain-containing protein n=1 Tax=uncultured Thiodictyon sp. TaxID=1846217 RepID=UPI0025FB3260|nr:CBS domain-containing protein [uncultured Thiodictyon sp.]